MTRNLHVVDDGYSLKNDDSTKIPYHLVDFGRGERISLIGREIMEIVKINTDCQITCDIYHDFSLTIKIILKNETSVKEFHLPASQWGQRIDQSRLE